MKRAIKILDSKITLLNLRYISGNSYNNKRIASILFNEQSKFCAYTDEFLSRTDAKDIEHFNPTLKDTLQDGYNNWFLVKHQWNKEKSYKWDKYQPVLHPTANDFEERIIYVNGDYIANSEKDYEAINLIKLLKLDDAGLAEKRKKYIARKIEEMRIFDENPESFFSTLLKSDPCQVSYIRAIREEFGIDILHLL